MVIVTAENLSKSFGERTLFFDINFQLENNDKVGLSGVNGSGKTTLFQILTGKTEADSGNFHKKSGLSVGFMEQHVVRDSDVDIFTETLQIFKELITLEDKLEEIRLELETTHSEKLLESQMVLLDRFTAGGGLTYKSRVKSALTGLGFAEMEKPVNVLSGGEKSKIQLAKLILSDADLLLLDEPTNHLDIQALGWLEKYLSDYKKAFMVISHDRYFLDKVTEKTFEIEASRLIKYDGNYTAFLRKKEAAREARQKKYELGMKEIAAQEKIIADLRHFKNPHIYDTIHSREKVVERLRAALDKPEEKTRLLRFNFRTKDSSGTDVLSAINLSQRFGGRTLFSGIDIDIKRNERVFLIGGNGTGKTSLFRCLIGENPLPEDAEVTFGARVEYGYFDQIGSGLHDGKTIFAEVQDMYPELDNTAVRNALGQFLFVGDDVFKKVAVLSGGEKARVLLLLLMLSGANFLLLDEPTNHLDTRSREALESALLYYPGTLFIISHDRYLINKLATRVYELDSAGISEYKGNYDYYLEIKESEQKKEPEKIITGKKAELSENSELSENNISYKERKQAEREARLRAGKQTRLEAVIAETEREIAELNNDISSPEIASDYEKITRISQILSEKEAELERLTEEYFLIIV